MPNSPGFFWISPDNNCRSYCTCLHTAREIWLPSSKCTITFYELQIISKNSHLQWTAALHRIVPKLDNFLMFILSGGCSIVKSLTITRLDDQITIRFCKYGDVRDQSEISSYLEMLMNCWFVGFSSDKKNKINYWSASVISLLVSWYWDILFSAALVDLLRNPLWG